MRKLAIWVDAAGLGLTALLPDWFSPIAGVYPIFFCSAFQWGVYSGADGFNSATVFITNNFKQSVLGWTQYALTKDKEFKRKAVLYSNTVLMFFLGALLGVTGVAAFGNALGACVGFIPLAVARIFISIGELPVEDETPEETRGRGRRDAGRGEDFGEGREEENLRIVYLILNYSRSSI